MARLFDPLDRLTPRQMKIVRLAYAGNPEVQIALMLQISPATLRWHTSQIRQVLPGFRFPSPPPPPPRPLTRREREIAALVAEGLDNGTIRKRLYISESTIRAHLANLYRKTRTANRVQLARTILIGAMEAA